VNPKLYRVRTLAGAKWTVTVTEQTAPAGAGGLRFPLRIRTCAVATNTRGTGIAADMRRRFAPVEPSATKINVTWAYFEDTGGRRFVPAFSPAMRDGLDSATLVLEAANEDPGDEGVVFVEMRRADR
jgi:hypothetical protein